MYPQSCYIQPLMTYKSIKGYTSIKMGLTELPRNCCLASIYLMNQSEFGERPNVAVSLQLKGV